MRSAPDTAVPESQGRPAPTLDRTNLRIIQELTDDGRLTMAELGRRVGLSPPAVAERVARLEESGVIVGYRAVVDPAALGFPVSAWIRVRPGPHQLTRVADLARRSPAVTDCHRITGEDCFLIRVFAPSMEDLEGIIDTFLVHGQTTSAVVVSSAVERSLQVGS